MTLKDMNKLVQTELSDFVRSRPGSVQNIFRAVYAELRLHSLGMKATISSGRDDVYEEALRCIRRTYPDFVPMVRSAVNTH